MPNQPSFGNAKVHKPPKSGVWRKWPTRAEVPGLYNVTPYKFAAAVRNSGTLNKRTGKRHPTLRRFACSDGNERFIPAELSVLFGPPNKHEPSPADADDDDDDDDSPTPLDPPVTTVHELMQETLAMLREVRREKIDSLAAALEPMKAGVDLLKGIVADARSQVKELLERIKHLEGDRDSISVERERLISENHARQLEIKRVEKSDARRDQIVEMLKGSLPLLIEAYGRGQGAPKDAFDLLARIDPKLLDELQAVLDPADATKLRQVREMLERLNWKPQPKTEPKPKEQANGTA